LARPKPPAPSSRVVLAFFVAAMIGVLIFGILFVTGRSKTASAPAVVTPAAEGNAADSFAIPRGGALRGSSDPDDAQDTISRLTQATLVRVNRSTDEVEPWLAASWTTSNNNLTYRLAIRPNILWWDGSAFTASDVVSAIDASGAARVLGKPLTARAISALDVEITFPGSFAPGLRLLDQVPIARAQKTGAPPAAGLGPFVLKESGRTLVFERNPHYWRLAPDGKALPYLDRVEIEVRDDEVRLKPDTRKGADTTGGADAAGEVGRLMSGEVDYIETELRPEDYAALKVADREDKARFFDMGAGLGADALQLNLRRAGLPPPMLTDDFRLAISAAVNRRDFCTVVYLGACDPVFTPVTPGNVPWYSPDLDVPAPDPVRARAMLAGIELLDRNGDGTLDDDSGHAARLGVLVSRESPAASRGAAFLRDRLKMVGIQLDLLPLDSPALAQRRKSGDYDAIFGRVDPQDTDPAMDMDFWIRPDAAADWERRANDLMLKQATTADRVARVQLFADVQKLYAQHMPAIFFGAPHVYVATNLHMLNVKPSNRRPMLLWNADTLAVIGRK
jgi:peptide/nickel transport system substrate-binding protein